MKQQIMDLEEELLERLFCLYNKYSVEKISDITLFYRQIGTFSSNNNRILKDVVLWARDVIACSEMAEAYPEENLEDLFKDLKKVEEKISLFNRNDERDIL